MRYLVTARVKIGLEAKLLEAIENGTLGTGSIAGDEFLRNMSFARLRDDGTIRWVEVCYCQIPLDEERPYWEEYFELLRVRDAHPRQHCRDENRTEHWACENCDCTERLEQQLRSRDTEFLDVLRECVSETNCARTRSSAD